MRKCGRTGSAVEAPLQRKAAADVCICSVRCVAGVALLAGMAASLQVHLLVCKGNELLPFGPQGVDRQLRQAGLQALMQIVAVP